MRVLECIALSLLILLLPNQVYAYLDPGTGSMLLQIILGGVAGLAILGRLFWNRLKDTLLSRTKKSGENRP